jgi:hypothetical protein
VPAREQDDYLSCPLLPAIGRGIFGADPDRGRTPRHKRDCDPAGRDGHDPVLHRRSAERARATIVNRQGGTVPERFDRADPRREMTAAVTPESLRRTLPALGAVLLPFALWRRHLHA